MRPRRPQAQYSTRSRRRPRWGQHFLVDLAVVSRIVDALAPRPGEAVLEIGPGEGALTAALLERQAQLAAVELDPRLAERLARRFGERLLLLREDVLRLDWAALRARMGLREAERLAVVGNLPYAISKRIAQALVRERACVSRAVLMFQREVAARLVARPGSRAYGPLAVYVGAAFEVRRLREVSPAAFRPAPRVVSSLTHWLPREPPPDAPSLRALRACLAACFRQRRRTLWNNLRVAVGEARARRWLEQLGLEETRRPEQVPPEVYMELAARWAAEALI